MVNFGKEDIETEVRHSRNFHSVFLEHLNNIFGGQLIQFLVIYLLKLWKIGSKVPMLENFLYDSLQNIFGIFWVHLFTSRQKAPLYTFWPKKMSFITDMNVEILEIWCFKEFSRISLMWYVKLYINRLSCKFINQSPFFLWFYLCSLMYCLTIVSLYLFPRAARIIRISSSV